MLISFYQLPPLELNMYAVMMSLLFCSGGYPKPPPPVRNKNNPHYLNSFNSIQLRIECWYNFMFHWIFSLIAQKINKYPPGENVTYKLEK